jgi:hypothetical protein
VQPLDGLYALGVHSLESIVPHSILYPRGIPIVMWTYGLPIVAHQLGRVLIL